MGILCCLLPNSLPSGSSANLTGKARSAEFDGTDGTGGTGWTDGTVHQKGLLFDGTDETGGTGGTVIKKVL